MASSFNFYNNWKINMGRAVDLSAPPTLKVTLHTSSYVPNASSQAVYADLNNELATANGYTNGGLTLSSVGWNLGGSTATLSAANAVWTASGGSIPAWRYAVVRVSGTFNTLVDPLMFWVLGDTTPADIPATTTGNNLTVGWSASGLWVLN